MLGWDGTDFFALKVDNNGHLQIDALGLIALVDALQSVGTDRLQVRGEDQLFGYKDTLRVLVSGAIPNLYLQAGLTVAGELWTVTGIVAWNDTAVMDQVYHEWRVGGEDYVFHSDARDIGISEPVVWSG
ncbi:unnamed protein product, partial [marine sediment metagenome]